MSVRPPDGAGVLAFSHVRLDVSDIERSVRFYREALCLEVVVRYELAERTIVQMGVGGRLPGLELWEEAQLGALPATRLHLAFEVADTDAAFEAAVRRGARPLRRPFTIGHERIAFVGDPDGYPIELAGLAGQA